jgi:flagellar protein FlbD
MIQLTRLNHRPVIINCDLIEHIETAPDTVLWLTSGQTFMVLETAEEVIERVVDFRRSVFNRVFECPLSTNHASSADQPPAD